MNTFQFQYSYDKTQAIFFSTQKSPRYHLKWGTQSRYIKTNDKFLKKHPNKLSKIKVK